MDHPPRFICPISQDLMAQAVMVNHINIDYRFDKEYIETWKRTPGGDTNPLTGLEGFLEANIVDDLELQAEIDEYIADNHIVLESDYLELYPENDNQQILEDFDLAIDLSLIHISEPTRRS